MTQYRKPLENLVSQMPADSKHRNGLMTSRTFTMPQGSTFPIYGQQLPIIEGPDGFTMSWAPEWDSTECHTVTRKSVQDLEQILVLLPFAVVQPSKAGKA